MYRVLFESRPSALDADYPFVSSPQVTRERLPLIVGPAHHTIKTIGATSEARIHVPGEKDADNVVTLEGSFKQVSTAFGMMFDYLAPAAARFRRETFAIQGEQSGGFNVACL